jgi:hypothetical protein
VHQFHDQLKQTDLSPFKSGGFVLEPPYIESVASHCKTRSARSTPGVHERIRSLAVLKVGRPNFDTPIVLLLAAGGSTPAMSFSSERISWNLGAADEPTQDNSAVTYC